MADIFQLICYISEADCKLETSISSFHHDSLFFKQRSYHQLCHASTISVFVNSDTSSIRQYWEGERGRRVCLSFPWSENRFF